MPWSASTSAPPSSIISPVRGSFMTAAVRPTPDEPLPVVYWLRAANRSMYDRSWDLATPGSPIRQMLMLPGATSRIDQWQKQGAPKVVLITSTSKFWCWVEWYSIKAHILHIEIQKLQVGSIAWVGCWLVILIADMQPCLYAHLLVCDYWNLHTHTKKKKTNNNTKRTVGCVQLGSDPKLPGYEVPYPYKFNDILDENTACICRAKSK